MGQINFFGVREDHTAVFDYIFTETNFRVFETYSEFDQDLREFKSVDELLKTFDLGVDGHGNASSPFICLWSPSIIPEPTFRKINLKVKGHTFRYVIEGCGLLFILFGGIHGEIITKSKITFFSEKGARKKCGVIPGPDDVNWEAKKKIVGKLKYHIQKRLRGAPVKGGAILKNALEHVENGFALKESAGTPWAYKVVH